MREAPAQRLSRWLVFLLILLLCLDVLITPFTPAFAYFRSGTATDIPLDGLMHTFTYDFDDGLGNLLHIILSEAWKEPYTVVLSLFLLVCGVCGAVLLKEGIRILASVADGTPFLRSNGTCLRRAAACCFTISGAALARTLCDLALLRSLHPLFRYTALFIPLFFMAGLFCLVTAPLFHEAADIQAENDTII